MLTRESSMGAADKVAITTPERKKSKVAGTKGKDMLKSRPHLREPEFIIKGGGGRPNDWKKKKQKQKQKLTKQGSRRMNIRSTSIKRRSTTYMDTQVWLIHLIIIKQTVLPWWNMTVTIMTV